MSDTDLIDAIQRAYPQLWLACHVEHRTRAQPHGAGLTDRESSLLAHIGQGDTPPGALAQHLGIAKSTLSAHLARLESLGLITVVRSSSDQRRRAVQLTDAGRAALRADSVLDTTRLERLLALVPEAERDDAVRGLVTLGNAARAMMQQTSERSE
jgi:DNA-binding MarR family transcriptional regulator